MEESEEEHNEQQHEQNELQELSNGTEANESELKLTIDEVIDRIGLGPFQWILMLVCGAGYAGDAMEIVIVSYLIPATKDEWNLNNDELGLLASIVFFGTVIGAFMWGTLGDLVGRKLSFMSTVVLTSLFGVLSGLAPNFSLLVLCRFLVGVGVGGNLPIDFSMFTEFVPTAHRGRYLVWLGLWWILGQIFVSLCAWIVMPLHNGWRWLVVISAIPFFLLIPCRLIIPESPRYLVSKNRLRDAEIVLHKVAARNNVKLPEFTLVITETDLENSEESSGTSMKASLISDPQTDETHQQHRTLHNKSKVVRHLEHFVHNMKLLLHKQVRRTTILLWIVWFGIAYGSYGTIVFFPTYFEMKGFSADNTYFAVFITSLANFLSFLVVLLLVNRLGRKHIIGVSLLLGGGSMFLFAFVSNVVSLFISSAAINFFVECGWIALYVYTPEVFPTFIRSSGMGMASSISKVAAVISPAVGAHMLDMPLFISLCMFAASFCVAGIAALCLPIETKNRKLADASFT